MQRTFKLIAAALALMIIGQNLPLAQCSDEAKTTELKTNSSTNLQQVPSSTSGQSNDPPASSRKSRASHFRQLSYIEPLIEDRAKQIENWNSRQSAQPSAERSQARNLYPSGVFQAPNYAPESHYTTSTHYAQSHAPQVNYLQLPSRPYSRAPVRSDYQRPESNYPQQQQQQEQQQQLHKYIAGQASPYVLYRDVAEQKPPKQLVRERVFELRQPSAKFYFTSLRKGHHKNRQDAMKTVVSFRGSESRVEEIEPHQVIQPDFYVQEDVLPALKKRPRRKKNEPKKFIKQKPKIEHVKGEAEQQKPAPIEVEEQVGDGSESGEDAPNINGANWGKSSGELPPKQDKEEVERQDDNSRLKELLEILDKISKQRRKLEPERISEEDKEEKEQDISSPKKEMASAEIGEAPLRELAVSRPDDANLEFNTGSSSSDSQEAAGREGSFEPRAEPKEFEVQQAIGEDKGKEIFDVVRKGENVLGEVLQKVETERAEGLEGALLKKEKQKAVEEFEKKKSLARNATPDPGATSVKVCTSIEDC